jgi:polyisoprenyl-teichoic acid--peptidoglycan teichoic acid transferase
MKVPRPGRGVLIRAAIAGVLTIALSATAVASAVLLQIHSVTSAFLGPAEGRRTIEIPGVTQAQAGDPRTFLILGSDQRYGDHKRGLKPRSDTILLVRANPHTGRIAVMSIPRDLKVQIPGAGTDKINAAYEIGGPRKTVATIKRLFRNATGHEFPINNVINVNFGGFQRAIDYIGGVYVDIDRRYFNDNAGVAPGQGYATINLHPGYQKLYGRRALDYVRYRHGDSDFFRADRQQDFLRQIAGQDNVRELLDFGQRRRIATIFGKYFQVDKSFLSERNVLGMLHMGVYLLQHHSPVEQIPFPAYESKDPSVNTYLYVHASDLRKTLDEFMTGTPSAKHVSQPTPTPTRTPSPHAKSSHKHKAHHARASSISGLERDTVDGENMAVLAETKGHLGFPFYFPTLRTTGSSYPAPVKPYLYHIPDEANKLHPAYRIIIYNGLYGEYYGVEGMSWRYPPILDNPTAIRHVGGRRLMLFYNGSHLRLVGWRTKHAAYWVTNTLDEAISNKRLVAIAGSLRRIKH